MTLANRGTYHFGDFELNLDLRILARKGERVPLGSKAYDVLTCLVAHAGEVVTKADLMAGAWAGSYVEEGSLAQQIFSLRKALGDRSDYIATIPGQGYRFMGAVSHTPPPRPAPTPFVTREDIYRREVTRVVIEEPVPVPMPMPAAPARSRTGRYAVAAAGLAVAALLAGWGWSRREQPRDHQEVVLADFTNTTGDAAFDRTLKRALEIDLEQTPYMDVLSERDASGAMEHMGLKPGAAMSPEIAREICERTNRRVLLTGSISSVSDEYLLTLEAVDCNTGRKLTSAKAEASDKVKLLGALDSLAERVRSKLGESAQSIKGYDVPLEDAATPSLEALKAYSIGKYMQDQGRNDAESLPLFQRAVELDPQFAQAYGEIAVCYYNLSEPQLAAQYLHKAFDLRNRVGAKEKLTIEAHYYMMGQGDVLTGLKSFQLWADTYPRDWIPWLNIANWYTQLGQYDRSIDAGRRALELKQNPICYNVLARAYKDSQRFADAKAVARESIAHGKDTAALHSILYEIAAFERDAAAEDREEKWLAGAQRSLHDYYVANGAAREGKYALADRLYRSEIASERRDGLVEEADAVAIEEAQMQRDMGFPAAARATLDSLGPAARKGADYAIERTLLGDVAFGEQYLAEHANDANPSTDMEYRVRPRLRAAVASAHGRPLEAIAALEAPNPYGPATDSLRMAQTAEAHLQAGHAEVAIAEYKLLANTLGFSFDVIVPMAHLGLARSYAKAGDHANARAEYETFLKLWQNGDPDLPPLKAAKAELAKLAS
jgi:DNA-binding winged helix-turn-helix (wHTH) protein/tetratricopeptide (TPR) repeat protein